MKVATAAVGLVVIAGAATGIALWRPKSHDVAPPPSPPAPSQPVPPAPSPPSGTPRPVLPPVRPAAPAAAPSEPQLMATLREIGGTAPERSIALAREGQRRFPNSADAPERDFIVVQSLVNLKRFHEAQDAARAMVSKDPDNPFALDAQRHLLVYPLDQPSREEMQQRMRRDQ